MMKNIPITVLFISLFVFSAVALAKSPGMQKEQLVTTEVTGDGFVPLNQPTEVKFTPPKPGLYRYACGMDMIAGVLVVE